MGTAADEGFFDAITTDGSDTAMAPQESPADFLRAAEEYCGQLEQQLAHLRQLAASARQTCSGTDVDTVATRLDEVEFGDDLESGCIDTSASSTSRNHSGLQAGALGPILEEVSGAHQLFPCPRNFRMKRYHFKRSARFKEQGEMDDIWTSPVVQVKRETERDLQVPCFTLDAHGELF